MQNTERQKVTVLNFRFVPSAILKNAWHKTEELISGLPKNKPDLKSLIITIIPRSPDVSTSGLFFYPVLQDFVWVRIYRIIGFAGLLILIILNLPGIDL